MTLSRFLTKLIPTLILPLGLATILILLAALFARARWQKGLLLLAFLLLFLGGNRWITIQLAKSLEWRYLQPEGALAGDVIVVLASGTHAADHPRSTPEVGEVGDRLIYAAHLYQQGAAPLILHSGEHGDEPGGDIHFLFGLMGVPAEDVLLETDSNSTYENAVACRKIIEQRGFKRVILVTSAAHMPRAVGVFTRQGIAVIPAPTGFTATQSNTRAGERFNLGSFLLNLVPTADNLKTTTRMLNEYLGIWMYRLRGWI